MNFGLLYAPLLKKKVLFDESMNFGLLYIRCRLLPVVAHDSMYSDTRPGDISACVALWHLSLGRYLKHG